MKLLFKCFALASIALIFTACTKTYKTAIENFMEQKVKEKEIVEKVNGALPTNKIFSEKTSYKAAKYTAPEIVLDTNLKMDNYVDATLTKDKKQFEIAYEQYKTLKDLTTINIQMSEDYTKQLTAKIDSLGEISNKLKLKITEKTAAYFKQGVFKVTHTFMAQFKNSENYMYSWDFYYTAKNEVIGYNKYAK